MSRFFHIAIGVVSIAVVLLVLDGAQSNHTHENSVSYSYFVITVYGDTRLYTLHAYDSDARHTGPFQGKRGTDLTIVEEQIPNSSWNQINDKSRLTLKAGDNYNVTILAASGVSELILEFAFENTTDRSKTV